MHLSSRTIDEVNDLALLEGWALFYSGSDSTEEVDSDYRLERDDEMEKFPDDGAAAAHVIAQALEGSSLHRDALDCLRQNGPVDFAYTLTALSAHERLALSKIGLSMEPDQIAHYLPAQS